MSFVNLGKKRLDLHIKRGFTFGPKTFLYRHGANYTPANDPFENEGYEAQLEVKCSTDGEPVFVANTEDSGGYLTIDPDIVLISLVLPPDVTAAFDFDCCQYTVFIYTGDIDAPSWSKPLFHGDFEVD